MADKQEKAIRVIWGSEEGTELVYANQLFVSHAGGTEFNIVFGQLTPPLTVGLNENELPEHLEIKPVAHIVIGPDVMRTFVRVLVDNLETFEKRLQNKEFEDAEGDVR